MSSRVSIQQYISTSEPAGAQIGDEWYNSTSGVLYKRTLVSGVVGWSSIGPLPNVSVAGQLLVSRGTGAAPAWTPAQGSGIYIKKTANYTAAVGDQIIADTTGGTFTVTLPPNPVLGNSIQIIDGANWGSINLTVARNGSTIKGSATDLIVDVGKVKVDIVYDGTTWQVYSTGIPPILVANDSSSNVTQYIGMTRSTAGWDTAYISTSKLYFNPSTGILNSTDFNSLSDSTLKENITPISDSIAVLKKIKPVSFNWKDTGSKSYGVIAQEIEKVLPELVSTNADTGIKSVAYLQLIAFLIDSINQQQVELNNINNQLGIK